MQCICLLCPMKRVKVVGLFPLIFLAHKHASCSHTGLGCWSIPAVCFIKKSLYWGEMENLDGEPYASERQMKQFCFLSLMYSVNTAVNAGRRVHV